MTRYSCIDGLGRYPDVTSVARYPDVTSGARYPGLTLLPSRPSPCSPKGTPRPSTGLRLELSENIWNIAFGYLALVFGSEV